MTTLQRDPIDAWSMGLFYEIKSSLHEEFGNAGIHPGILGERIQDQVIKAMETECQTPNSSLLCYVQKDKRLRDWYENNFNRFSDHFLEMMPIEKPYTHNPEQYANIWGNMTSQVIGVIYGNMREEGLS